MHELTITKNLVSLLEDAVRPNDVGLVKTVHLEVGRLRYLVPEIMTTCFSQIEKSDKLKQAKLDLKVLPVKLRCSDCDKESCADENNFTCSFCLSQNVDIISGKEFILKSIEW